jgi:hypothetical protein
LAMIVGSRAIWITPWSASDGSRLPSGPDRSFRSLRRPMAMAALRSGALCGLPNGL